MTDIAELERRVPALEAAQNHTAKSQNWMAAAAAVHDAYMRKFYMNKFLTSSVLMLVQGAGAPVYFRCWREYCADFRNRDRDRG